MMKNEKKKIPKPVWFFILLLGFLVGNAIGGLILAVNLIAWAIINLVAILGFFILDWRYGEILQKYIPRYKKQEKGEST